MLVALNRLLQTSVVPVGHSEAVVGGHVIRAVSAQECNPNMCLSRIRELFSEIVVSSTSEEN